MHTPVTPTSTAQPHASAGPLPAWQGTYPGTPDRAGQIRAALRPVLAGCPRAGDVLLVVSELAANAIVHSDSGQPGGTLTIHVRHRHGDHILAEVRDQGSGWDGDLARSACRPHGLYLVAALASACGTTAGPGRSRTVWARLDDPAAPPAAPGRPVTTAPGRTSRR
jgi:serine/threonine-protein kinase RsbW